MQKTAFSPGAFASKVRPFMPSAGNLAGTMGAGAVIGGIGGATAPKTKDQSRVGNAVRGAAGGAAVGGVASVGIHNARCAAQGFAAKAQARARGRGYENYENYYNRERRQRYDRRPPGGGGGRAGGGGGTPVVPDWLKGAKTKKDAKSAWRTQARQHHPDTGGNAETFKRVSKEWDDFEKHHFSKLSAAMINALLEELDLITEA